MDTPSLTGRPVTLDDLDFVEQVWNDERVSPTIGGPRSRNQLRDRIERWLRHRDDHGFGATMFVDRVTGEAVGWGGLQHATIGIGDCLTAGYVVDPTHWGRGHATEIARAAVDLAFGELSVDAVHASVLATNHASRRVLDKAGFRELRAVDHDTHVELVFVIER